MPAVGEALLRLALVSLHWTLWAREAVTHAWLWLWMAIAFSFKHKGKKLESITADRKELRKVPTHLALVIQEEHISCDDLACLAVWAFASDVQTVSIYDPFGHVVKEMVTLGRRLRHHQQQLFSPPLPPLQVLTSQEAAATVDDSSLEEFSNNSRHRVVVLSGESGFHSMVETAVEVCQSTLQRGDGQQVDVDSVSNRITGHLGVPDPELALVFGPLCSTVGYPPWKLRLTEIHTISSHHKVTYQQFLQVLQKYSSCQQRCGK